MTARRVGISRAALEDIDGIVQFAFGDHGPATDARIAPAVKSLERMSEQGRIVPELRARGITSYRELVALPYRIIYRVEAREVVGVFDHRRDLDSLLHERARRDL